MKANEAKTVKVGSGNTAVYYLIYKGDINSDIDSYVYDSTQRNKLLADMKKDEFAKYVDDLAQKTDCEKNQSVLDQYKPELYFVKPESSSASSSSQAQALQVHLLQSKSLKIKMPHSLCVAFSADIFNRLITF